MNITIDVHVDCPAIDSRSSQAIKIMAGGRVEIKAQEFRYTGEYCERTFAANGHGRLTFDCPATTYHGKFRMGRIEGFGRCRINRSTQYTGYFINGRAHGIGECETPLYRIRGSWANGSPDGHCLVHDKESDVWFAAVYHAGKQSHLELAKNADVIRRHSRRAVRKRSPKTRPHNIPNQNNNTNPRHTAHPCLICCERPKKYSASPCGHYYACQECQAERCAICRQPVLEWIKIYECT